MTTPADDYGRHAVTYRVQEPGSSYPVEPKVKAAAAGVATGSGAIAPFLLYLIDVWLFGGGEFNVPVQVVGFVEFAVGVFCALAGGYLAPHVDRLQDRQS